MKKGLMIAAALVALCAGLTAEAPAMKGTMPLLVQAAFYTPTYQCIYLKGSDKLKLSAEPNTWNTYTTGVSKATIDYDGMGGNFKGINVVRLKANTKKSSQEIAIYIDNIVVTDGSGKAIQTINFEDATNGGVYSTQGKPFADHATIVEKDGKKCFLLHMKSENLYGYNGVEVQWTLPANTGSDPTWDLSKGDFSVKYDYYISVAQ